MRRSNFATLVYLLVVFASGAVVGGFANRLYMAKTVSAVTETEKVPQTHAELNQKYIQEMRSRLHLTDAQIAELKQIMDSSDQRMREMKKSIKEEHIQKVVAMLDDGQKAEYAKWRADREKRRQQEQSKK
jgi:Spy/CpxP family protein refolding chaperone